MSNYKFKYINELKNKMQLANTVISGLLNISESTLRRRKLNDCLLENEYKHIQKLLAVIDEATDMFENQEKGIKWLKEPARSFAGKKPIDLMNTEQGIEEVRMLIQRIEHGICI